MKPSNTIRLPLLAAVVVVADSQSLEVVDCQPIIAVDRRPSTADRLCCRLPLPPIAYCHHRRLPPPLIIDRCRHICRLSPALPTAVLAVVGHSHRRHRRPFRSTWPQANNFLFFSISYFISSISLFIREFISFFLSNFFFFSLPFPFFFSREFIFWTKVRF